MEYIVPSKEKYEIDTLQAVKMIYKNEQESVSLIKL